MFIIMKQGYLKFTGDYSKLQSMGYTFQKLYADNYMSWRKDDLIIWKRGAELVINNFDGHKLITFMRTRPTIRTYKNSITKWFYKIYTDVDANEYYFSGCTDEELAHLKTLNPTNYSSVYLTKDTLATLRELNNLGWYKLVDH